MRIREAGDSAVLLELGTAQPARHDEIDASLNARVIHIADAVRRQSLPGVRDVASTFRSVAVFFDPLATDVDAVIAALEKERDDPWPEEPGTLIEVPVVYGGDAGPDLAQVAACAGCTPETVVERHAARTYRVCMLGFLPGFPYMAAVDDSIAAPRRPKPRLRVPAGSVGIAGRQTGIYPCESPGGWQIIGRTALEIFDAERTPPAAFAPGDRVRFVPVSEVRLKADNTTVRLKPDTTGDSATTGIRLKANNTTVRLKPDTTYDSPATDDSQATDDSSATSDFAAMHDSAARYMTVLRPGLLTTIQDAGRWGYQHLGVPVSGPMDPCAHRLANALVGNPRDAATLEATVLGPEVRFEQQTQVAVAGADLQPTLDGTELSMGRSVQCPAGSVLRFGGRRSGARVYVAVDGGVDVPRVLGSRATHVLSRLGGIDGRALRTGDRIPLGAPLPISAGTSLPRRPCPANGARLRIMPGPQIEYFHPSALEALERNRYTISPQSDRMGYRLTGGASLALQTNGEMLSDATVVGAVQVPPSGQPIVLMADRQTSGGYPQIAVVITADLPLAAQLAPGDWVEFVLCSRADAIAALTAQEGWFVDGG
ncbi:MAG: 5-oxoprolinase subunit PxpB [Vicinamibacterales bacterium]